MRLTFQYLSDLCEQNGFHFEKVSRGRERYELFSNKHALGVTSIYENLSEAWLDIAQLPDRNPLTGELLYPTL